jgi:hypothetical protein
MLRGTGIASVRPANLPCAVNWFFGPARFSGFTLRGISIFAELSAALSLRHLADLFAVVGRSLDVEAAAQGRAAHGPFQPPILRIESAQKNPGNINGVFFVHKS